MLRTIQNLRAIAHCCRAGSPLDGKLAGWLGDSLEEFLAHRATSIEEALGLRAPRGGVPWWREEAMRHRDALLREFAAALFSGLSVCATARQIRVLALRYAATAWRFDRSGDAMPEQYRGTAKEWLWRIFKAGAPMPIGERHLRTILARTILATGRK
ncbi:MAG TPA: hypothetical protein VFZ03_08065 [Dongiaceae bacterium]